jgi:hypothetical protein
VAPSRLASNAARASRGARPRPGAPLRSAPAGAFGDLDPPSARQGCSRYLSADSLPPDQRADWGGAIDRPALEEVTASRVVHS